MNKQEIFDTVAKHIFTQGERAANSDGRCYYRVKSGGTTLKCAVGVLIPDAVYNKAMDEDSYTAYGLISHFNVPLYFSEYAEFLRGLQRVHDHTTNWPSTNTMRAALWEFGKENKLDVGILNTLSFKDR